MSYKQKEEALETSKEMLVGNQQEVLLVQLQSGGVGLNLQHCDRIVFMGPWWTAALMDQAIGRAVRIGQTEKVEVHHLILKEEASMNIDKKMLAAAEKKRDLCARFLSLARIEKEDSAHHDILVERVADEEDPQ
jgi:SNF2 family DNA or RNA helicase